MAKKPYIAQEEISKISNRIKQLRIDSGYTSYETFAFDKDLDRKQYWRMENGQNVTIKSLVKILNCHNITWNEFFKSFDE